MKTNKRSRYLCLIYKVYYRCNDAEIRVVSDQIIGLQKILNKDHLKFV